MKTVVERFLKYVSFDTASMHDQDAIPSTDKQKLLAEALVGELKAMGIKNARMDEHGYVYEVHRYHPRGTDRSVYAPGRGPGACHPAAGEDR